MSARLEDAFARARTEKRAALITYFCAGDPSLDLAPALINALAEGGADVIEVGVPFSDPTADGPTIQRASERAPFEAQPIPSIDGIQMFVRSRRSVWY